MPSYDHWAFLNIQYGVEVEYIVSRIFDMRATSSPNTLLPETLMYSTTYNKEHIYKSRILDLRLLYNKYGIQNGEMALLFISKNTYSKIF